MRHAAKMPQSEAGEFGQQELVVDTEIVVAEHEIDAGRSAELAQRFGEPFEAVAAFDDVAGDHDGIRLEHVDGGDDLFEIFLGDAARHVQVGDVGEQLMAGGHMGQRDPFFVHLQVEDLVAGDMGEPAGNAWRGEVVAVSGRMSTRVV